MDAASHARRWQLALLALVAARLALAPFLPLLDDEAYYWAWSRHPALSYFDHPAGVALLIRASTAVLGHRLLAVHLPAILGLAATSWIVARLFTRLSGDAATAWKAVFLLNLAPTFGFVGMFTLPDAPLLVCWTAAASCVYLAVGDARPRLWYLAGVLGALGLVSKYSAILLPVSVLLYLVASPDRRRWLRRPQPYAAAAIMALGLVPILIWNQQHGWASFQFHLVDRHPAGWRPAMTLGRFVAGQMEMTPPIVVLIVWAWAVAFRRSRRGDGASAFVFWMSVPAFVFFLALGTFTMGFPYWTDIAYVLAVLPAAQLLARAARWVRVTTWGVAAAASVVMFAQVAWPVIPFNAKADPTTLMHGWGAVAVRLTELRSACGDCFVFSHRYQDSASVSFYLDPSIPLTRLTGRHDQYSIWRGDAALRGRNAIYFCDDHHYQPPNEAFPFSRCRAAGALPIVYDGRLLRTVSFWQCDGYEAR